jgi:hypothetical protein
MRLEGLASENERKRKGDDAYRFLNAEFALNHSAPSAGQTLQYSEWAGRPKKQQGRPTRWQSPIRPAKLYLPKPSARGIDRDFGPRPQTIGSATNNPDAGVTSVYCAPGESCNGVP